MKKALTFILPIILFLVSILALLGLSLYSSNIMEQTTQMLEANTQQLLVDVAKSAAKVVSAQELEAFRQPDDMKKPLYNEIKQRLDEFAQEYGVLFVYYLRPYGEGQLQFVVDNDSDPETMVSLNDIVDEEPAPMEALGGTATTAGIGNYSVDWEGILAAYAPVYNPDGSIYCIAGVDMSDELIVNTRDLASTLTVVQIIVLVVALATGVLTVVLYQIKAVQSESANVAKSQFLSRMSHEIRTPLNAIIGLSRMAGEIDDIPQIHQHLDNIGASSAHLLRLINDILDLSKIESGKVESQLVAVDTTAELESVRSIIAPQAAVKGLDFAIKAEDGVPRYVYSDDTHVKQVMVNLLSNAVKFTPEGGRVTLGVRLLEKRADSCHLEWRVQDSGIGIDPRYIDRLFDPFEQGDNSTTRKYGGTGLGLAISKQLIEKLGGSIGVTSQEGQGSTFFFDLWLPLAAEADLPAAEAPAEAAGPVDLTGKRVLLVEDSEINQLIAEDIIGGMGAKVELAGNGRQAVEKFTLADGGYDLIFMDVQMPVMDGYQATRAIRSSGLPGAQEVPIIAMTANVFKEDVQQALNAGMNAHVGKPFEVEQIRQAIAKVMTRVH